LAKTLDRLLHRVGSTAEVAPSDATVHVDDALHGVVRDDGGIDPVMNRRDVTEELYRRASWSCGPVRERRIGDLVDGVSQVDRRLRDDVVIDAVDRIEPVVRRDQAIAAQRRKQSGRDLLFGNAELERLGAVNIDLERRVIQGLCDSQIRDAGNHRHFSCEPRRNFVIGIQIVAGNLCVDRGRQPEVQDLVHNVGRHEVALDVWKLRRHHVADALLVDRRRMMLRRELNHDLAVLRAEVVAREERDRIGLRQIDIVANLLELVRGNYLPDRALDFVDE